MSKDQSVDRGRWKLRKRSADAVGQFDEETVAFFDEGRHVPSEILVERHVWVPHQGSQVSCPDETECRPV